MSDFQVGDRVLCVGETEDGKYVKGENGVICTFHPFMQPPVGVQWDKYSTWKHDCDHTCKSGHGWFVYLNDLVLEDVSYPEDELEIEIGDVL